MSKEIKIAGSISFGGKRLNAMERIYGERSFCGKVFQQY